MVVVVVFVGRQVPVIVVVVVVGLKLVMIVVLLIRLCFLQKGRILLTSNFAS